MEQKKMTQSRKMTLLATAGGLGFWVLKRSNFAISLNRLSL